MSQKRIHIGRHRLDTEGLQNLYSQAQDGGIVAFTGTVRNATSEREVLHLDFEAYEPMAVHTLEQLRGKTIRKFGVRDVVIHHRLGRVLPGHAAVVVDDLLRRTINCWASVSLLSASFVEFRPIRTATHQKQPAWGGWAPLSHGRPPA